ncbi:hypothetical protein SHIRM173S_06355 [Streptomyces hirsutus]
MTPTGRRLPDTRPSRHKGTTAVDRDPVPAETQQNPARDEAAALRTELDRLRHEPALGPV